MLIYSSLKHFFHYSYDRYPSKIINNVSCAIFEYSRTITSRPGIRKVSLFDNVAKTVAMVGENVFTCFDKLRWNGIKSRILGFQTVNNVVNFLKSDVIIKDFFH